MSANRGGKFHRLFTPNVNAIATGGRVHRLLLLCSMPDRQDGDPRAMNSVKNDVRRAANNQFAKPGFRACAAQVGIVSQSFDNGNDSSRETSCGIRLIQRHVSSNLLQPSASQRRPNNLYRHSVSSSWFSPQTHWGGGISFSVPQERSQAFISSCLT